MSQQPPYPPQSGAPWDQPGQPPMPPMPPDHGYQGGYPPSYPGQGYPGGPGGYPPGGTGGYPPGGPGGGGYPGGPGYGGPGYPPDPGWQQPYEVSGPAPGIAFAGRGTRLVAYIVDAIIVGIVMSVVMIPLTALLFRSAFDSLSVYSNGNGVYMTPSDAAAAIGPFIAMIPLLLLIGLIGMAYFVIAWARGGQTLGMKMLGIRVVRDRDGGRVGWGAAIVRLIGFYIGGAIFYLGFIWIFIDARRRGWHDILAGTVVIADRR